MTAIGIVGASYCGSTLVSVLLDGLPHVAAVGETHCIIDDDISGMPNCRTCGNECKYLTNEFFDYLRADPSDWWDKFKKQMNMPAWWLCNRVTRSDAADHIDYIVASEKWFAIYDRLGLPDIILLIWRNPISWCCSWLMHQRLINGVDVTLNKLRPTNDDINIAVFHWINFYQNALRWIRNYYSTKSVSLHFDKLLESPYDEFKRLCSRLGLEYSDSAIDYTNKPHHHIRGNGCVTISSIPDEESRNHHYWKEHLGELPYGKLTKDTRYKKMFTSGQIRMIEENPNIVRIVDQLSYVS